MQPLINKKHKHMKTTKIAILLLVLITTTSCMFDGFGIKGNRNVVSEDREIYGEFNEIKVSEGIQVFLTQGEETALNVEADENIIDLLVTEVQGNVLKIHFEKNVSRAAARNVYLTANEISSIKSSSGSAVKSEGTINSQNLYLSSSSGASLKLNLNATNVTCSSSSGAHINLSGTSNSFESNASSGSHIKAVDLSSKTAKADVSSGAGITLQVSEALTAHASSGGNISYEGNPAVLNKSKSSGGGISQR